MELTGCHSYVTIFQIALTTLISKRTGIMLSETVSARGVSPHFLLQGEGESSKREETHVGSLFVSALSQTSERYMIIYMLLLRKV